MIYECPSCKTPQEAGQTVCPHCFAQFDGPVPADAVVPPPSIVKAVAPEAETEPSAETEAEAASETDAAADAAPPLVEVKPPPAPAAPSSTAAPYLGTPAFAPPAYETPASVEGDPQPPLARLSRLLLIAFPIVLILVLGGVFYANSLNTESDALPVTPPTVRAVVPATPPAAPVGTPTVLQGGGSTGSASQDPRVTLLAGRWVARSGEFYVFNSDGTGSHGDPVQQKPDQSFLWGLSQNRLMLYEDQDVPLHFNQGPDNNTIFLASPSGHYLQFSRSKT